MMPGENHSKTVGLASDATAGACQNCTVLRESINEYVAALLSLKQKIIDTDHLLTEYQEKCDELQRSQTETSKLHQQLDELLEKMVPLEKQNKDYESLRFELEEKKSTLEKYEKAAVEVDSLREENSKAKALSMKLENQLQQLEETVLKQRNENGQLKREKEALEEELEKAKSFQKVNHQAGCEIERFKEENARIQAQKKSLENQFELLKESSIRHILEIQQLKLDKQALEGKLHKTQRTLEKLLKETQKETRNSATQTNAPKEPKIDKAKVRLLLEELWKCVEPQTANGSLFSDDSGHSNFGLPVVPNSPLKRQNSQALPNRTSSASFYCESLKAPRTPLVCPGPQETAVVPKAAEESKRLLRKRKRSRNSDEHLNASGLKEDIMELDTHEKQDIHHAKPTSCGIQEHSETSDASMEEIFAFFRPLPPLLAPLSSACPPTKEAVFGVISDSSDEDDEVKPECINGKKMAASLKKPNGELCLPHQEDLPSTKPEFRCSVELNGQSIQQTADGVAESKLTVSFDVPLQMSHCTPLESVCERHTVPLTVKLKDDPLKSAIERPVVTAMPDGSYSSTTVSESLSCEVELDLPEPVKFETPLPNREDVAEKTLQHDKMDAEDSPIEDALDITPNVHQDIQSTSANVSEMELQKASDTKGILRENRNNLEVCEDVEIEVQSPADRSNVTINSLSNGFIHSECNETEVQKPSDILNNLMKENSIGALNNPSEKCETKATGLNGCAIFSSEHLEEKAGTVKDLQHNSSMQNSAKGNGMSNTVVHFSNEIGGVEELSDTVDDDLILNIQAPIITIPKGELSDSVTSHDKSVPENYRDENNVALKESNKPNEQQTNISSAGETESSREIFPSMGEETECMLNDVKDATASVDPVMEDNISSCLDNLATHKESSDEQESFELQRKVRRNCQRTSSQASSGNIDALSTLQDAAQKCVAPEVVQDLASMHSLNEDSDHSSSSERTQANLGVQLSPTSKRSETEEGKKVLRDSLETMVQESVPGSLSFENVTNGSESSSEELSLDHQNILEQKKAALRSPLTSPNLESFSVPISIIMIDSNEKTDKSQSENEMSSDDCAKVNKQVVGENGTVLPVDSAPAETCRDSTQEHSRQPSDNVSERLEVIRSEELSPKSPLSDGADISPSTKSPGVIKKVRSEMGPPLPPLLLPLTVTPKKPQVLGSPSRIIPGKLSFLSPSSETASAEEKSPLTDRSDGKSQSSRSLSPSELKHERIISSPLQFCSATPKHAVPVPGRFPASALSSSPNGTQENSVRILDTMYPELSARARTLNILRGNVNLSRSAPENSVTAQVPVSQITGFKSINSSSTAFTKTGKSLESENGITKDSVEHPKISEIGSSVTTQEVGKKTGVNVLLPSSAKRLRLDSCSPVPSNAALHIRPLSASAEMGPIQSHFPQDSLQTQNTQSGIKQQLNSTVTKTSEIILNALTKVLSSCFDLLPVIKSHVSIGRISKLPVLRDEEKDVIAEFCTENKSLADDFLCAILTKLKMEKNSLSGEQLQALCRVYTGLCRQRGDWERPHLLAYSILKEDFPNSAKLILFMVTTWYNILPQRGVVFNAMHSVIRQKADGEVLQYLTAYLGWETNSPCKIQKMIAKTLVALKMGTNMKFQHHDRHGDDLSPNAWEYIFAIDLLCTEKRWAWTYDNIISKELWPIMNKWVSEAKHKHGSVHDITVATVLRLIGRLGQLGLKEKSAASVKNVAKIINMFGRKGNAEGVPWAVQLAAVYTIYDLSPSDPKDALEALAAWRADATQPVPPAVTSCITQIGSVCRLVKT
ncbi:little elongation complex subunit 1 isoform X2 [Scleropages formosus]|uniref:little elongation complex subunit 1 isoform X2 n=1 Tax=Scleropages formosus TaxID=113540 RepID=UPI0008783D8C|nr:little elongation complex subunit 1 isoform X2 [Scleropages formosus]